MELEGKIAIVTGAAGNLGSACAREVALQGAKTVATDLPGTRLEEVVAEIRAAGGTVVAHQADIACESDVKTLAERARDEFGGLDTLVNVAAKVREAAQEKKLEELDVEFWDAVMAVNLRGSMLCCKHAVPLMRARGSGSIINFGSTAAILGDVGLLAYSTTKSGLLGFTRAVATTYGKEGIRCNAVCPGSVWPEEWTRHMEPGWLDLVTRTRLTPRLGLPQDIANMVVFLSSDKASYVTGQTFVVDGGGTAHQPWVRVN